MSELGLHFRVLNIVYGLIAAWGIVNFNFLHFWTLKKIYNLKFIKLKYKQINIFPLPFNIIAYSSNYRNYFFKQGNIQIVATGFLPEVIKTNRFINLLTLKKNNGKFLVNYY